MVAILPVSKVLWITLQQSRFNMRMTQAQASPIPVGEGLTLVLADHGGCESLGWAKTIQSCGIYFQSSELLSFFFFLFLILRTFCAEPVTFWQGNIEWSRWGSNVRPKGHLSPRDILHSDLMFQQLSHLGDWKYMNFLVHNTLKKSLFSY